MDNEMNDILKELKEIKVDIKFIKSNMVDRDEILTKEEEVRLEKGLIELKEGKTTSLEKFEKELEQDV